MTQAIVNKIAAAIEQYELDKLPFQPLSDNAGYSYTSGESKLLRRIDIKLLPMLSLFYCMAFLDRGNINSAAAEGMLNSIQLSKLELSNCLMIFFVSYCIFQVPSNLMSKRTTPGFWFPTIMCLWGVVMTCMGLVVDYRGLFWSRFFLGTFEAGIVPGISFYLSLWYKRSELQFRLALFFSTASAVGAFGGLLAYFISKMEDVGGMEGWRWIFVLEGCTSVCIGVFGFMFMCSDPINAKFLNEDEKVTVVMRVKTDEGWPTSPKDIDLIMERAAKDLKQTTWNDISSAILDWQCYVHAVIFLAIHIVIYAITLHLPILMGHMGYKDETAQLVTLPIYMTACIGSIIFAVISDKIGSRSPTLIFCFFMMLAGNLLQVMSKVNDKRHSTEYAGIFIAAIGAYGALPNSIAWLSNNTMSAGKRNISLAIQIGFGNLGGILASYVYQLKFGGETAILILIGFGIVAIIMTVSAYRRINRSKKWAIRSHGYKDYTVDNMIKYGDRSPFFQYTY